jgi:galactoside O-acetyltransferase
MEKKFMTQTERMKLGLVYFADDPAIMQVQAKLLENLYDYNHTRPRQAKKRAKLLNKMFGAIGENAYIEPPFHSNWAGKNCYIGRNFYANFNLTLVDDEKITIGDYCMFAPNVVIATAGHPINPKLRKNGGQYNAPVKIGNSVWIGAGAIVMPGVTIGDNVVIGAGSIVTKDIPSNVVAFGNPCKVYREVGERDNIYYFKDKKIDWENIPDNIEW